MRYKGEDRNEKYCMDFIETSCEPIRNTENDEDGLEIFIYKKENNEEVAVISGFLYNYEEKGNYRGKVDAFHIKALETRAEHGHKGIATFLMKEAIKYAEKKQVKYITVNPCAKTDRISQEDLEKFYKNFVFTTYNLFGLQEEKSIEFERISD